MPSVRAFWSITLYDPEGFQVADPLNRFAVSSWMPFKYNVDGSLDLYFQNESPGKDKEANACRPWNLHLLPHRLSETRTALGSEAARWNRAEVAASSIRSVCGEFHAVIVSSLSARRMTILRASSVKDAAAPSLRPAFSDTKPVT